MSAPAWKPPTQPQLRAAEQFTELLCKALRTPKGIAYDKAILCSAQLAGTFLLRSLSLPLTGLKPGALALSEEANQRGPLLVTTLGTALRVLRIEIDPRRVPLDRERAEALDISALDTQHTFEREFAAIVARHALTLEEAAHACSLASAQLIQMHATQLDAHVAFGLASYGFLQGAKTVPLPPPDSTGTSTPTA